jgi:hypothetical protein
LPYLVSRTKAVRTAADKDLAVLNKAIEPIAQAEWELENSLSHLGATPTALVGN